VTIGITMVTLDQSLAVNTVQAHIGDNVEIRCDIVGEPQPPAIKWTRYNVDLSSVNIPNMKVCFIKNTNFIIESFKFV
jgi:hypothetical protein